METRVKERLVGAAILVGLIVVLVPEMLSGPQQAQTGAASSDAALQTYTIDLSSPGRVTQQSPPTVPQAQDPRDAQPSIEPDLPVPAIETPAEIKPQAEPAPTLADQPNSTRRSAASRQASEVVPRAQLPPPPPKETPVSKAAGWAVQLGSFASQENAKRLVGQLRAKGYKAFVSTSGGTGAKARHRVRVGPEPGRAQAEKLAERLKRDGRQVTVVSHP